MNTLVNLFLFLKQNKLKFIEDFDSILFQIPDNLLNKILLSDNFWENFDGKREKKRFRIIFDMEKNGYQFPITIFENFSTNEIDKNIEDIFKDFYLSFSYIKKDSTKEDFNQIYELLKNEIINSDECSLRKCRLVFSKKAINDYLSNIHIGNEIKFLDIKIWSSLELFSEYIQKQTLEDLSSYLYKEDRLVIILIFEDDSIRFSNFFEIYSYKMISKFNDLGKIFLDKFNQIRRHELSLKNESKFENVPIFPLLINNLDDGLIKSKIWRSISKIVLYYILSIYSIEIEQDKSRNETDCYRFNYSDSRKQIISFGNLDNKILEITIIKEKPIIEKIKINTILEYLKDIEEINFFENIGNKESILLRQSSIRNLISKPAINLISLFLKTPDLLDYYKNFRKQLFEKKLGEIKDILEHLETRSKKSYEEISSSTTKITEEISKYMLSIFATIALAVFSWFIKFLKDVENPDYLYVIIIPLIVILLVVFMIMQLFTYKWRVKTEINNFNKVYNEIAEISTLTFPEEMKNALKSNENRFNVYFITYLVISFLILAIVLGFLGYGIYLLII